MINSHLYEVMCSATITVDVDGQLTVVPNDCCYSLVPLPIYSKYSTLDLHSEVNECKVIKHRITHKYYAHFEYCCLVFLLPVQLLPQGRNTEDAIMSEDAIRDYAELLDTVIDIPEGDLPDSI